MRLELGPTRVLDLRRSDVLAALGPRAERSVPLDRSTAQELGRELRRLGIVEGLLVPSMAFLDRPDRFNLVLFVEALPNGIAGTLSAPRVVGSVRLRA